MLTQNELQSIIFEFTDDKLAVFTNYAEFNQAIGCKRIASKTNGAWGRFHYSTKNIFINIELFSECDDVDEVKSMTLVKQCRFMEDVLTINDAIVWTLLHELYHHFKPKMKHVYKFYAGIKELYDEYKSGNIIKRSTN